MIKAAGSSRTRDHPTRSQRMCTVKKIPEIFGRFFSFSEKSDPSKKSFVMHQVELMTNFFFVSRRKKISDDIGFPRFRFAEVFPALPNLEKIRHFLNLRPRPVASIQSGDITLAALATISVTNYQTLHP